MKRFPLAPRENTRNRAASLEIAFSIPHGCDHYRFAIATEGIFQQTSQLAVSVWNVHFFLALIETIR